MKKLLLSFVTLAFLGFFFAPATFAATIYSNDLTGGLAGFTGPYTLPIQSDCSTSASGVSCVTLEPAIVYGKGYYNLQCVQADITHNGTGADQLRIGSNGGNYGIDLFHNVGITFGSDNYPNDIVLNSANPNAEYDTGVAIPSGTHNYRLCNDQSTNTFTIYIDSSQVFSQQIAGTTALYEYGWMQVAPGDYIKNFVMSGDVNFLTTYTNDLTGSLAGFLGAYNQPIQSDCSTSANGVTCATLESAIVYNTGFLNLTCVQVDITHNGSGADQLRLGDYQNGFHNVGITFGTQNYPNNIVLNSANPNAEYDTGVVIPSGTHTYELCNDSSTDTFTVYLDNSQIFSQQIAGITAAYQFGWMQVAPDDYMKNFVLIGSQVQNSAPQVSTITVSPNPVQVSTQTTATGNFTDADISDTHTAVWDWGDGTTSNGTLTESNGSGSVANSHIYTVAGVYPVTLTVTDNHGGSGTQTFQYVSVYNPTNQGLFSAGQKYTSPVGALTQNLNATGTVLFGLSYRYQGGMPTGTRQFSLDFNKANFHFNATSVNSLVISNGIGTLTGTGTVNGSGTYSFLVTGSETAGTVRIRIEDSLFNIVYDTQPGAADTATPTTPVTGNVLAH